MDSILTSIKKLLGISEEYEQFDQDIVIHINSVFSILNQLGVGPEEGFSIKDSKTIWKDYCNLDQIEFVKTYVYLKVRVLFDPPTSSSLMEAMNRQINELEWRLSIVKEN